MRYLLALAAALALVACGDDDPAPSGAGTKIQHKFGTTEVPADPVRVVAVGFNDQDFALALGVVPVGVRQFQAGIDITDRPWAQAALDGAEPEIIGAEQLKFETIAGLRPDLILGVYSGMTEGDYGTLSKLAPTVAQSDEFIDYGEPWQQQLERTGRALGKEEDARRLTDEVEQAFADARADNPVFARSTMAFGYGDAKSLGVLAADDLRTRFFTDLGFTVPSDLAALAEGEFSADISNEQARLLDQDLIVIYGDEQSLAKNPLFTRLDAVREDRVLYLEDDSDLANAINFSSPLSLPYAIDAVVPQLKELLS